jgi:CBS domain-containing protein
MLFLLTVALEVKEHQREARLSRTLSVGLARRMPPMNLAKSLRIESVSRLHPLNPLRMSPSQTVAEAVALLRQEEAGCLLVCEDGNLVGIFTERDLLRRILAQGKPLTTPLAQCMTPNPTTVQAKESVAAAIQRMEAGGYRNLPVVDDTGKPLGVLSVKQIVHYIVEHFPGTVYNLPPEADVVQHAREGA